MVRPLPSPWSQSTSAVNPMLEGFSVSGEPLFGFGLADAEPKGGGRPLFAE